MEIETLSHDEKEVLSTEVPALRSKASAIVVRDKNERSVAEAFVKKLRDFKVHIEERFRPTKNKQDAYRVYEQLLETEKAFYVPITQAIETVTATVKEYDRLTAIAARQAQEKAEQDQRDAEQRERERLEGIARQEREKARLAEEEKQKADERAAAALIEKREAEDRVAEAAASGDTTAKKIAEGEVRAKTNEVKLETQRSEEAGRTAEESLEKAEVIQDQSESVQIEPKPLAVPEKVKKLVWKAKVVSIKIACRSIGEGLLPFTLVDIKPSELNKLAKDHDGKTRIPGIEFYEDVSGRV